MLEYILSNISILISEKYDEEEKQKENKKEKFDFIHVSEKDFIRRDFIKEILETIEKDFIHYKTEDDENVLNIEATNLNGFLSQFYNKGITPQFFQRGRNIIKKENLENYLNETADSNLEHLYKIFKYFNERK